MHRYLLFLIGLLGLSLQLPGQQHLPGQLIVQLKADAKAEDWQLQWNTRHYPLSIDRQLSRPANIWLFQFDPNMAVDTEHKLLQQVCQHPKVLTAQFNHPVELRSVPNDPSYGQQWWLNNTENPSADLNAEAAWDITTGGQTGLGDTIVVAVIDNGVDLQHEDLQRNLWINHDEIPGNNIDDDNNGYVDDYRGWSIITDDDNVSGGGHGTPVTGIIGADGNNARGVTGLNWNVKLMIIKNNFNTDEARVLEAYSYPLEQRMLYDQSGGQEGAFVVATNASWGRRFGRPSDAPTWCSFYDFLGRHGIINIAATVNDTFNVEEVGDLPTTCTSDFLITVTNIDRNNEKVDLAGYGATSIDLAAYGREVLTTRNGNRYDDFQGTSAATPMVTAAAALLYSVDCPTLLNLTQSDPAAAALLVREAILASVAPTPSLADTVTVTGGRLDAAAALSYLQTRCQGCIAASSTRLGQVLDTSVELRWNTNDSLQQVDLRWRELGSADWQTLLDVSAPYTLAGLTACSDYEYELRSVCASETIPFGNRQTFQTEGCCVPPVPEAVSELTTTSVRLRWASVFAADSYELRFREQGTDSWNLSRLNDTTRTFINLTSCTVYEWELRTDCGSQTTEWRAAVPFTTLGCGPCLDLDYCAPDDLNPESEYIQEVDFAGLFRNSSERPTSGYTDFGSSLGLIAMEQGAVYPFELTPGFVQQELLEAWRIWIDFDHNGQFTSNEIMYTSPDSSTEPVQGSIQIPADARLGLTRMRIMMRFLSAGNACPFGDTNFGEAEDYCVQILPSSVCPPPGNLQVAERNPDGVRLTWAPVGPAVNYQADFRAADENDWQFAGETNTESFTLTGLDTCTTYLFRVQTNCFDQTSEAFRALEFTSSCVSSTTSLPIASTDWLVYPNPTRHVITLQAIRTDLPAEFSLRIYNSWGQLIRTTPWRTAENLRLNSQTWPAGLYTLTLWRNGQLWASQKVVKQR